MARREDGLLALQMALRPGGPGGVRILQSYLLEGGFGLIGLAQSLKAAGQAGVNLWSEEMIRVGFQKALGGLNGLLGFPGGLLSDSGIVQGQRLERSRFALFQNLRIAL